MSVLMLDFLYSVLPSTYHALWIIAGAVISELLRRFLGSRIVVENFFFPIFSLVTAVLNTIAGSVFGYMPRIRKEQLMDEYWGSSGSKSLNRGFSDRKRHEFQCDLLSLYWFPIVLIVLFIRMARNPNYSPFFGMENVGDVIEFIFSGTIGGSSAAKAIDLKHLLDPYFSIPMCLSAGHFVMQIIWYSPIIGSGSYDVLMIFHHSIVIFNTLISVSSYYQIPACWLFFLELSNMPQTVMGIWRYFPKTLMVHDPSYLTIQCAFAFQFLLARIFPGGILIALIHLRIVYDAGIVYGRNREFTVETMKQIFVLVGVAISILANVYWAHLIVTKFWKKLFSIGEASRSRLNSPGKSEDYTPIGKADSPKKTNSPTGMSNGPSQKQETKKDK